MLLRGRFAALALGTVAALASSCGPPDELVGVYEEEVPLDAGRRAAIRVTLFEYAGEAGGHLEIYPIGEQNSADSPYLVASSCLWFGPRSVQGTTFYLTAEDAEGSAIVEGRVRGTDSGDSIRFEVVHGEELLRASPSGEPILLARNPDARAVADCPDDLVPDGSGVTP